MTTATINPARSATDRYRELQADAGGMLDLLDEIVHRLDTGRLKDCVVLRDGQQVWLIDELARAFVEAHQ